MMLVFTATEVVWGVFLFVIIINAICHKVRLNKEQEKCKHDGGVHETRECRAICKICSKELGFIGDWRKVK
jgi:hypothetical protein